MTDSPASLGTERIKFAAEKRGEIMRFSAADAEPTLFTEAVEAELIELHDQRSDEGKQWFNRVMGILGKGKKTDDQRFTQVHEAVEAVAQSQADMQDQFSRTEQAQESNQQAITKLTADLAALQQKIAGTDGNFSHRPPASGGNNVQMADY